MNRRVRLWGMFAVACVLALALLTPLRLVLGTFAADLPIAARDVSGSLWAGRLHGARWGAVPLDTLGLRLRLLPLLYGQQQWVLAGDRIATVLVRGRTSGIRDASGELDLALPASPDARVRLGLDRATVLFREGRCETAEGRVSLDLQLPVTAAGDDTAWPPSIHLDGRPTCSDSGTRVEFAPAGSLPTGIDTIAVTLDIDPAGSYRALTTVRTGAPGLRLALQAHGFDGDATALVRNDRGHLLH